MRILVTSCAGFIGFHTARVLEERGNEIIGIDNLSDYYDVTLKKARLNQLTNRNGFQFHLCDLADCKSISRVFNDAIPERVINLAAQAGVRYSLENPQAYVDSNITGFLNVFEGCLSNNVEHLVFASTSSVYGANTDMPFRESQNVDHLRSFYAATKNLMN